MKILLDENIPVEIKKEFKLLDLSVLSVKDMNWQGVKNGTLLRELVNENFDALITMDKNIKNQQNIGKANLMIIILKAHDNKLQTLKPLIRKVEKVLMDKTSTQIVLVE